MTVSEEQLILNMLDQMIGNELLQRKEIFDRFFSDRTDLYEECDYPKEISTEQYSEMYERELGNKIVNLLPDHTWKMLPSVYETEDLGETTPFEEAFNSLSDTMNGEQSYGGKEVCNPIFTYLHRLDQQCGIGSFGVMLLGIDDGKELHEPAAMRKTDLTQLVNNCSKVVTNFSTDQNGLGDEPYLQDSVPTAPDGTKYNLTYVRVYPESKVSIYRVENDPRSPRYGFPVMYQIQMGAERENRLAADTVNTITVHWTRIIHVADNKTSSEVVGMPRQQAVFNRLLDLRKIYGGSAEMFWQGAFPGLSVETHPQMGADAVLDVDSIKDKMEQWRGRLQRWIGISGASIKSLAPQLSDPSNHIERQIEAISIILDVPKRILMGSERGELSSSQDSEEWDERVGSRRSKFVIPSILRPTIDRLINLFVLPIPASGNYNISWEKEKLLSPTEKATVGKTLTEAIALYITSTMDLVIPFEIWLTTVLGLPEELAEEIGLHREAMMEEIEAQREEEKELAEKQAESFGKNGKGEGDAPPTNNKKSSSMW